MFDENAGELKLAQAVFYVELPFWLAVPSQSHREQFRDLNVDVCIHNDMVGVFATRSHEHSKQNLFVLLPQSQFVAWSARQEKGLDFHHKNCRTVFEFGFRIPSSLVESLSENGPQANRARQVIVAFAHDLLPLLNRFIDAYLAETSDPFAYRVSEWDCPVWHFRRPDGSMDAVSVQRYLAEDALPRVGAMGTTGTPEYKSLKIDTAKTMSAELRVLTEAWGAFYRRQYEETIVKVVTAIEVIVDIRLVKELLIVGYDQRTIKSRLEADSFYDKIKAYNLLSSERIPGPIISPFSPEVNRVRLFDELEKIRRIRNKAVHEARAPIVHRGMALKIIETMSWLARCISGDTRLDFTIHPKYVLNSAYTQVIPLPTFPVPDRDTIDIDSWESSDVPFRDQIINNILANIILDAYGKDDLEYAVYASLTWIGFDVIESTFDGLLCETERERYEFSYRGSRTFVFILRKIDESAVLRVEDRMRVLSQKYGHVAAIIVFKGCCSLTRPTRIKFLAIEELVDLAYAGCVFEFQSVDARLRVVTGTRSGEVGIEELGTIYRVLDGANVICVDLQAGKSISVDQLLAVGLGPGFRTVVVKSIEINKQDVTNAIGPAKVGLLIDVTVNKRWKLLRLYGPKLQRLGTLEC